MTQASPPPGPLDVLLRWEGSGALWRVSTRSERAVRIELLTCTGGEVMQVLESSDADLLAYVGNRSSSEG